MNDKNLTKNRLCIISCFRYKNAKDFQDLSERNVVTDIKRYLEFCYRNLGYKPEDIVLVSDMKIKSPLEKFYQIKSKDEWISVIKNQLSLLSEDSSLFFIFSGHGEKMKDDYYFVIPTGYSQSKYLNGKKFQDLLVQHLPKKINCLMIIDTCYSAGLVDLKYTIKRNESTQKDVNIENRKIISFHSSKKKQETGLFVSKEKSGSVFSSYLLEYFVANSEGEVNLKEMLSTLTYKIEKQRTIQPQHEPIIQTSFYTLKFNPISFLN